MTIRKAVIPMAGKGTRFYPLTRIVPKDCLPLGNVPIIDYVIREALAAGCEEIICVVAPGRELVSHYWPHANFGNAKLTLAPQQEPRGLGHAVACAREAVGGESFFVLLPDMIFDATPNVCAQLGALANDVPQSAVIATHTESTERLSQFGVVDVESAENAGLMRVRRLVEKPAPGTAPSDLIIVGRYLLPATIFDELATITPGAGGELQLTDALQRLAARGHVHALRYDERAHFDTGQPEGWLAANNYFAQKT